MPKYTCLATMRIPRALLLGFFLSTPAGAQIMVEPSSTVGTRALQIETSLTHSRKETLRSWSTPTLVRLGIGEALELRAESDLWVREASGANTHTGVADLSVGLKWTATVGQPGLSLLLHTNLPTGSHQWQREGVHPSLRGILEWNLAAGAHLGIMPGVERSGMVDGVETTGFLGLALGKGWGKRFRTFLELELYHIAGSGTGGNTGNWNAGGTYLLG